MFSRDGSASLNITKISTEAGDSSLFGDGAPRIDGPVQTIMCSVIER